MIKPTCFDPMKSLHRGMNFSEWTIEMAPKFIKDTRTQTKMFKMRSDIWQGWSPLAERCRNSDRQLIMQDKQYREKAETSEDKSQHNLHFPDSPPHPLWHYNVTFSPHKFLFSSLHRPLIPSSHWLISSIIHLLQWIMWSQSPVAAWWRPMTSGGSGPMRRFAATTPSMWTSPTGTTA